MKPDTEWNGFSMEQKCPQYDGNRVMEQYGLQKQNIMGLGLSSAN